MRTPSGTVLSPFESLKFGLLFLVGLCTHNPAFAQLTINGDLFIADNAQMHVDVPKTVFLSGEVLADRGTATRYGLMSFGANSTTERADHNTHVNGFVRSYNSENFVYPIGHDNILQPVHFKSDASDTVLDFAYSHLPHTNLSVESDLESVSDEFYWTIHGTGGLKGLFFLEHFQ